MKAIINSSKLVTCTGLDLRPKRGADLSQVGVIEGGAIIVDGSRIRAVGTEYSLRKTLDTIPDEDIVDVKGRCVIPGFVDSHTHALFAGTRENEFAMRVAGKPYMEILKEGGGILSSRKALQDASDEEILDQSSARLDRMLSLGTTTVEIKSGYGLSTEQEVRSLKLIQTLSKRFSMGIHATFLGAHAVPPEYKGARRDFVKLVCNEMLPVVASRNLAEFCDVFCEEGVFTVEDTAEIFEVAQTHGLKIRLHSDEITALGGTELACSMGAVSVDHLVAVTPSGIEALAASSTLATLLPGTSYSLMKSYAPAREMIEQGVAIALATDCNPGSCYTESMPMIISLACLNMGLSPEEALNAATYNGACALGCQENRGSLEVGKEADLVVLRDGDYRSLPYHFGVNPVWKTMSQGQWMKGEESNE
jgi:imidazolonepropionase